MEVQVVIKAPNQNVEDYAVHCNLEWTVQQLKENLAKAYPSKPKVSEQKLIYSGRLLLNHLRLKDILRHEDDDSSVHILHLVCSSDSTFAQPSQTWGLPAVRPLPLSTGQSTSNTVRQRNVTSVPPTNTNFPPNLAPQPPTMPVFIPDSQVVAQYAAMQQMYAYYFSQYIQSMNPAIVPAFNPAYPGVANYQPPTIEVPAQNEPPQENLPPEADEFLNRDWLDHIFQCGRFVILFVLVFYYSTPERLGIVMLGALIALLYQEGWFMRRVAPPVEAPPTPEVHDPSDPPDLMEEVNGETEDNEDPIFGEYELAATMDGDDPPHAQQTEEDANNNHIFSPLTFLSAFFSSLIPDPPPAPININ